MSSPPGDSTSPAGTIADHHAARVAVEIAPPKGEGGGTGSTPARIVLRLDPPELGRVEIRIVHAAAAPAKILVNVERETTLALLQQDAPALHRALDQAGVASDGRSVALQLGGGWSDDMARDDPAGRRTGGFSRSDSADLAGLSPPADPVTDPTPVWRRAGLNIVA